MTENTKLQIDTDMSPVSAFPHNHKRLFALEHILSDGGYPLLGQAVRSFLSNCRQFAPDGATEERYRKLDTDFEAEVIHLCRTLGLSLNALKGVR